MPFTWKIIDAHIETASATAAGQELIESETNKERIMDARNKSYANVTLARGSLPLLEKAELDFKESFQECYQHTKFSWASPSICINEFTMSKPPGTVPSRNVGALALSDTTLPNKATMKAGQAIAWQLDYPPEGWEVGQHFVWSGFTWDGGELEGP